MYVVRPYRRPHVILSLNLWPVVGQILITNINYLCQLANYSVRLLESPSGVSNYEAYTYIYSPLGLLGK